MQGRGDFLDPHPIVLWFYGQRTGYPSGTKQVLEAHSGACRNPLLKNAMRLQKRRARLVKLVVPVQNAVEEEPGADQIGEFHPAAGQAALDLLENAAGLFSGRCFEIARHQLVQVTINRIGALIERADQP